MNLSRIIYLRNELDLEEIDLVELSEIEGAFRQIPANELIDLPENAMASDMLDELEARVLRKLFILGCQTILVKSTGEANDPSWDISLLAERINSIPLTIGTKDYTLKDLLDGE